MFSDCVTQSGPFPRERRGFAVAYGGRLGCWVHDFFMKTFQKDSACRSEQDLTSSGFAKAFMALLSQVRLSFEAVAAFSDCPGWRRCHIGVLLHRDDCDQSISNAILLCSWDCKPCGRCGASVGEDVLFPVTGGAWLWETLLVTSPNLVFFPVCCFPRHGWALALF